MNELNSIADKPSASHVITVSNYNQLESVSNQLMSMACGGMYDFRQVLF
jgi:hypothetical protein